MSVDDTDLVPTAAKQMYGLGIRTETAVKAMYRPYQGSLFTGEDGDVTPIPAADLELLAKALLHPKWSDDEAAALVAGMSHRLASATDEPGHKVDVSLVSRWVLAHFNDSASVLLCMDVEPPNEVEIRRVLSRAGSQKLVFLGSWRLTQKDVVVKRLLNPTATALRELESFPLNLNHPNIIETHRLENRWGELFLLEELLPDVLSDQWRAVGVQEATNLLHDVAAATKYLHEHDRVHGDIKPDNIGRRDGIFILLDFGICRAINEFSRDATATGSLRTRAPELLLTDRYVDPTKVDVWALGATVFASVAKRFPLLAISEKVPRITAPTDRERFEAELARRVVEEWDKWVDLSLVPEELRAILADMLHADPNKRPSSAEVLDRINKTLPAYLHGGDERALRDGRFSPLEELAQLTAYLRTLDENVKLPPRVRTGLRDRLKQLEATQGFSKDDQLRAATAAAVLTRFES